MPDLADRWNAAYFGGRLSPAVLAELRELSGAAPDARALADRAFRLMRVAGIEATDVSVFTAWLLGFSAPRTVPSAWSGMIPPLTLAGRHRKLDDYVAGNPWHQPDRDAVFVDIGCGFPPLSTVDTARRLPGWRVIGVDPAFGRFLVYDADGTYACFDDDHRLRYYQSGNVDPDPAASRARFRDLFERLLPLLPPTLPDSTYEVTGEPGRLIHNPLHSYQDGNLELVPGEIGMALDGGADVIRCMNVLMYFDDAVRQHTLRWAASLLRPGGLFIGGSNWADSASSRYTVYRKEADRLVAREFAFSVENIRPIELAPWYALHDDNHDNLANAHAVGTIRADRSFRHLFDDHLDELLAAMGMCVRGTDGYLGGAPAEMPPDERARCSGRLAERLDHEGFADLAAAALRRSGRDAWRNHVGHVAVRPPSPPPLPGSALR